MCTTQQDIAAFYRDLIVFHVYGDHRAYEKILRMFRSLTAADVILQTDHGDRLPDRIAQKGCNCRRITCRVAVGSSAELAR